jgi:hypothetical protein
MRNRNRGGLQIFPIHIDLKTSGETIQRKQYPAPLGGRLDLRPIIEGLLKDGVLELNPASQEVRCILSAGTGLLSH